MSKTSTAPAPFFRETPGLTGLYTFPGLAFFALGPTRLMLRETGTPDPACILSLQTPDIGIAHRNLTAKGLTFTGARHMIHKYCDGAEEWTAFFKDDEGRNLALHSVVRPPDVSSPTSP